MSSRSTDKSKVAFSTRAGTGRTIHAQAIDTRTVWARRGRELYIAIMSDLGGQDRLSELELQLVRPGRWACYPVRAERGLACGRQAGRCRESSHADQHIQQICKLTWLEAQGKGCDASSRKLSGRTLQ